MMTQKQITEMYNVLQDIQEAQVDAGGRYIRTSELKDMPLGELLKMLIPNHVKFNIKYVKR